MPKEAPVIDQIRAHRKFLQRSDLAAESELEYPRTRKASAILSAKEPPTLAGALRKKARDRYSN